MLVVQFYVIFNQISPELISTLYQMKQHHPVNLSKILNISAVEYYWKHLG